MKERKAGCQVGLQSDAIKQRPSAEIFNSGNQAVVNLTKEAQGVMYYKAQK